MDGNAGLMNSLVLLLVVAYTATCFGKIASRLGKNPVLFGILCVVPMVNLVALGVLAFREQASEPNRSEA